MDWKRTVRHLIPNFKDKLNIYTPGRAISKFPFNPFVVPPGIESNVYVNQVVDVLSQAFTLGDGSRSILRKAIASIYAQGNLCPTAGDIIKELEKVADTGRILRFRYRIIRNGELEAVNIVSNDGKIAQKGHYRIKRKRLENYIQSKTINPIPKPSKTHSHTRRFPKVKNHLGL